VLKKAIFFDFDGTIADTAETGVSIFNAMAREYGFFEITEANRAVLRDKGPREVMRILEIPAYRVPTVVRGLRNGIREVIPTLRVMDGMAEALTELKRRGYFLGIVTSNLKRNVRQFLRHNHIDFFDYIRAGSGVFRKTYAIRMALFVNNLEKSEVMFVGDEIRDVEAARKVEVTVAAVTWGINSRQGLLGANPDFVVDSAEELLKLLS
jgi:phosphoglycolate phosphatase-like HAD superfamily hydrolase